MYIDRHAGAQQIGRGGLMLVNRTQRAQLRPLWCVVALCLNNPRLQENHLFKIINRGDTHAETIRLIAAHQTWSSRALVRYSLVRNEHTPLTITERFLELMRLQELRDLYIDPSLPVSVKPLVYRELLSRGQEPQEQLVEQVFEIDENDDKGMEDFDTAEDEPDETAENG